MISIIIPTHNRRELLEQAISSALSQNEAVLEVIVVDDLSTDDTWEFLSSLKDPRVRVLRNAVSLGAAGARNAGAARARGDILSFLDDDDFYFDGKLSATEKLFDGNLDVGVIISPMDYGSVTVGFNLEGDVREKLINSFHTLPTSSLAVRRSLFEQLGGFDATMTPSEDLEFCLRASMKTHFATLDRPYVFHRQHAGGRLVDSWEKANCSFTAMLRKNFPDGSGKWNLTGEKLYRSWLAQGYAGQARTAFEEGDRLRAVKRSFDALMCDTYVKKRFFHLLGYLLLPDGVIRKRLASRKKVIL